MSFERGVRGSRVGAGAQANADVGVPGKRTLTESLGPAVHEIDHDATPSNDAGAGARMEATVPRAPAKDGAPPGAAAGEAHAVPDIGEVVFETDTDTVAGTIAFTGAASRGGSVDAGDFGTTSTTYPALTNVKITKGTGSFTVSADFAMKVEWQVLTGDGPSGQVSIAGDSDPALTKANYSTAASDLTPNMSNTGGKPPRTQFWARDLTEIHEKFHADERIKYGKLGVTEAVKWLTAQTAADEAGVTALLSQARDKIIAYVRSKMVNPGKEERAYADGAPKYKARADAIKKKGDAGGYP